MKQRLTPRDHMEALYLAEVLREKITPREPGKWYQPTEADQDYDIANRVAAAASCNDRVGASTYAAFRQALARHTAA